MHFKKLFILISATSGILLVLLSNYCSAQDYIGNNIKDVIMIKGSNYVEENKGTVAYVSTGSNKVKLGLYTGVEDETIESFSYDGNNKVIRHVKSGLVDEKGLSDILNENNRLRTRVNAGVKQDFFQWIDTKESLNITLTFVPFEKGLVSNEKCFLMLYEITKE